MAGSFTNYTENAVLGHIFGSTTMAKPTTLYVALYTVAPGEGGGGTEVGTTGTGYARQTATFTVSGTAPTQAANSASIEFPVATTAWGTITGTAILDAATGGNMLAFATLTTPKPIDIGDVLRFSVGSYVITLE